MLYPDDNKKLDKLDSLKKSLAEFQTRNKLPRETLAKFSHFCKDIENLH